MGQTAVVKIVLVTVLIALVIVSVPGLRSRYLGKYAAAVVAAVWVVGLALVILT